MKKRVFAIVPTVILCILLFYLIKPSQSPKSPYQNLTPISGFSIQAVQAQYTIDTKQISLCITNHSDNSPELYLPYLEQNINETWVIVKKSPHIRDTDNLLYIPSGESPTPAKRVPCNTSAKGYSFLLSCLSEMLPS